MLFRSVQSASILLREGLEVILILSALNAYILKIGARHHLTALYSGAVSGVAASFGLAMIIETFLGAEQSQVLEGIMLLLASALMIYVSGLSQVPNLYREEWWLQSYAVLRVQARLLLDVPG